MYDLSILIPARNEEFLKHTVEDILEKKKGKTQIIVGLDGYKDNVPQHKDVMVLEAPEAIGQRAMQNRLARLSDAKYVMKVDAHCMFDDAFDVKMLDGFAKEGDDVTFVPVMRNLWVFDWKCMKCGSRWYMGPKPTRCMTQEGDNIVPHEECDGQEFTKRMVWKVNPRRPNNTAYVFDANLQFWYFNELKRVQQGDYPETLSLQGSCFMATRQNYFDKELCDESWGSWGQQGTEVALKTWLSGGRVLCNRHTWYAHMFRTQPGFSFPYPQSGRGQEEARKISQELFFNNKWPKQTLPLSWLLEKFREPLLKFNRGDGKHWTPERLEELSHVPLNPVLQ